LTTIETGPTAPSGDKDKDVTTSSAPVQVQIQNSSSNFEENSIDFQELRILDEIEQGTFGILYRYAIPDNCCSWDLSSQCRGEHRRTPVTIQKISQLTPTEIQSLKKEAAALLKLMPHPNVLGFRGWCTTPEMAIVTSQYNGMSGEFPSAVTYYAIRDSERITKK
jgi:hypothetical protein